MGDGPSKSSATHLWLVLMKAHRSVAKHAMRSLEPFDLGGSEFATLEVLLHKGPQKVNDIGRIIDLTSGSITSAVDRLEDRGLVARGSDMTDRRSRIVCLTTQGRAYIVEVFAHHQRAIDTATGALTKAERKELTALLKKLGLSAESRAHAKQAKVRTTSTS